MIAKKDGEGDEHRKATVPPPASGDAYSAETIVRDVAPEVLEALAAARPRPDAARPKIEPVEPPVLVATEAAAAEPPPVKTPSSPPVVFEKDDYEDGSSAPRVVTVVTAVTAPKPQARTPAEDAEPVEETAAWKWFALAIVLLLLAGGFVALYLQPSVGLR